MEELILKYLKHELNQNKNSGIFNVGDYLFVKEDYFKQISEIFKVNEIKMIDIIYGYFEYKLDYKIFVFEPKTFILDFEDIEDDIKLHKSYPELINMLLINVIKLKHDEILKENYEEAANYRDIEKELETKNLFIN